MSAPSMPDYFDKKIFLKAINRWSIYVVNSGLSLKQTNTKGRQKKLQLSKPDFYAQDRKTFKRKRCLSQKKRNKVHRLVCCF